MAELFNIKLEIVDGLPSLKINDVQVEIHYTIKNIINAEKKYESVFEMYKNLSKLGLNLELFTEMCNDAIKKFNRDNNVSVKLLTEDYIAETLELTNFGKIVELMTCVKNLISEDTAPKVESFEKKTKSKAEKNLQQEN